MNQILLVTGMSGAGRSTVSAALEDVGWSVVDNLPVDLISRVSDLAFAGSPELLGVAFVLGRSGRVQPDDVLGALTELRTQGHSARLVFLDAPDEVLIHRFEGTRRRHPFPAPSVAGAIAGERVLLQSLRDAADLVIETGTLNSNQLRARVAEVFHPGEGEPTMRVALVSFGFAHGIPRDVDVVFDCRFLPNPHWIEELRPLTGKDGPVAEYVLAQPDAQRFLDDVTAMLAWQVPAFAKEGKAYLTIAIGCTGGRHRSVAVAEEIARRLVPPAAVFHRDLDR